MRRAVASLILALAAACAADAPVVARGKIQLVLTIDWEGFELTPEALAALETLRASVGPVPITHFVSAAYMTNPTTAAGVFATLRTAVRADDELAVHLHAWSSLARASGVDPRTSPSFLTGSDELVEFDNGDSGFDLDPDAYSVPALRAMLRTSRELLEKTRLRVSRSFRAGGFLSTPKTLLAVRSEGFTVDCSAIATGQVDKDTGVLPRRVAEVWPKLAMDTQPYPLVGMVELPIAAIVDYSPPPQVFLAIQAARDRLRAHPERDVFVVIGFHFETAVDYGPKLAEVIARAKADPEIAAELGYLTVEQAAELARFAM